MDNDNKQAFPDFEELRRMFHSANILFWVFLIMGLAEIIPGKWKAVLFFIFAGIWFYVSAKADKRSDETLL